MVNCFVPRQHPLFRCAREKCGARRTKKAARAESSLLELCRVAFEVDECQCRAELARAMLSRSPYSPLHLKCDGKVTHNSYGLQLWGSKRPLFNTSLTLEAFASFWVMGAPLSSPEGDTIPFTAIESPMVGADPRVCPLCCNHGLSAVRADTGVCPYGWM